MWIMFWPLGRLCTQIILLKDQLCFLYTPKWAMLRIYTYLLHVKKEKCLVLINGHYYYLWDLVNILSHVTQELSRNCSGYSAML